MIWPFNRLRPRDKPGTTQLHAAERQSLWPTGGDYSLTGSEAVFGAVTMLSNTIASMTLRLYKGWEEATEHPLHRLIAYEPSPRMTPYSFWQAMETCRDTAGNCYALKVPGLDGQVAALDVLDPQRVTLQIDEDSGDLWYLVTAQDGAQMYISRRNMLHCRHVSASGHSGVNPVDVLRATLQYDERIKRFSLDQARGIKGAVLLEIPADLDKERRTKLVNEFLDVYHRSGDSVLALTGGMKATTLNRNAVDPHVLDVDRITANKVARVYNLPPVLLGDYSQSSYSSQEQQQLEYLERTVVPIARMYEAELNCKMLTYAEVRQGYRFAFDMGDLMVADGMTRANMAQIYARNGVRTIDEIRREHGRGPVPGGNHVLVSRDLIPLEVLLSAYRIGNNVSPGMEMTGWTDFADSPGWKTARSG